MALQIKQTLRQTQQLVMTPQLQQAIKLLQYNHLDMVGALEHEIRENPLLEVVSHDEPLSEQEGKDRQDIGALEESVKEPDPEQHQSVVNEIDWGNYLETYGGDYAPVYRDPNERSPLDNMAGPDQNLFHYLLSQLRLSPIEGDDRRIALEIIGNLDDAGYLDAELAEIAEITGGDPDRVESILKQIQTFDPVGVAARNARECLLIQARQLHESDSLVVRILEDGYDEFQLGRLEHIARRFKVSLKDVKEAVDQIVLLEPRPGRQFLNSGTVYVVPDIYIVRVGDDYEIIMNDDGLPRLKVSSFYQQQLHSGASAGQTRDYIKEKMRGAEWLIKSIHQRQRTIYKVAESILKFQRDFFDKGVDHLKPLILKDVAEDIEMHESTISRVTTNKYMHTPRGIFELKYFFNSGIRHGADSIASESVKNHIARIIKSEDPKKPVSDKQIVDTLSSQGIEIARRTVAKYRELMDIPPSSRRKKKY